MRSTRSRTAKLKKLTAASVVATIGLAAGIVVATAPAQAATGGTGWGTFGGTSTAYKGTFKQGSNYLICGEAGKDYPDKTLTNAGLQTATWVNSHLKDAYGNAAHVTAKQLAGINKVMHLYSATGDKNTAAALEYAIRAVLYPMDKDLDFSGGHQGSMDAAINYDLYSTAGAGNVSDIQDLAASMISTINSTPVGTGSTGSGDLTFTADLTNSHNGTVQMDGTAGSTGSITLTNGVFVSTGTNTMTGAQEGVPYAITGVIPAVGAPADPSGTPYEDGDTYKIWGTGSFTAPGTSGYAANIRIWTSGSGQQTSLSLGGMATNAAYTVEGQDPMSRSVTFQPVLTTKTSSFVGTGTAATDDITFASVADSAGLNNPWFVSAKGNYAPVKAEGTLYGPFATQPKQSAAVPAGAPVAGHATVTTSLADGPTKTYTATSDKPVTTAGYYTWVWSIDAADQAAGTQRAIPTGYSWVDEFAQVQESTVSPSDISIATQVTEPDIALSGTSFDKLDVSVNGLWNQDAGKNIPVTLHGTAYYVSKADAPDGVKQSAAIPAYAKPLGSVNVTMDDAGAVTPTDGVKAPAAGEGYVTWVWALRTADQPKQYQGYFNPFTSDFGVSTETQPILQPTVTTQAQPGVKPGETMQDTAIVDGTLPDNGAVLSFDAFLVPTKVVDGKTVVDAPATGADGKPIAADDLSWVCTDANRIYDGSKDGQTITETGTYDSPKVKVDKLGEIFWVESLRSVPDENGDSQLIAQGKCGTPGEVTHSVSATTQAQYAAGSVGYNGEKVFDTAVVTGSVPEGSTIEFQVYANSGTEAVCTKDTLLATISTTAPIAGGFYSSENPLTAKSVDYTIPASAQAGNLFFIEQVKDSTGQVIAHGECGVPGETLGLKGAKIASFAPSGEALLKSPLTAPIAGGVLSLGILGLIATMVIRRRKASNTES